MILGLVFAWAEHAHIGRTEMRTKTKKCTVNVHLFWWFPIGVPSFARLRVPTGAEHRRVLDAAATLRGNQQQCGERFDAESASIKTTLLCRKQQPTFRKAGGALNEL